MARILDQDIDIHLPYASQGPRAFNGRDLDEKVVNPFLQAKSIPCTKGPYLSTFRRQAKFVEETRERVRDKAGYDSLLALVDHVSSIRLRDDLLKILQYLLFRFARLRGASSVPITRVRRFSLEQYEQLLRSLLSKPSGGLYPVLLVVAMFRTIQQFFQLNWKIEWQGINVADAISGAGGDITVTEANDHVLLAAEITERVVDRSRVISTFNTKISPNRIEDYLFIIGPNDPTNDARSQARRYFAQGHEVNFVHILEWIVMLLATFGKRGRDIFNTNLMGLLDDPEIPQAVKVAWNDSVSALFGE